MPRQNARVLESFFGLVSLLKQSASINTKDLMQLKTRTWLKSRKQWKRGGSSSSQDDLNTSCLSNSHGRKSPNMTSLRTKRGSHLAK